MINLNERCEVAVRLRQYASDFDFGDSNPYLYVQKAVFGDVVKHDDRETFSRLADLIDPTCRIICVDDTYNTPEVGRIDCWHYECNRCGSEMDDSDMDALDNEIQPFDYCPYCGARVIN